MTTRVDSVRLLTLRAAERADRGQDVTCELSMATVYATEAAIDNANDAVGIHGGTGYTTERDVERYLRDAQSPAARTNSIGTQSSITCFPAEADRFYLLVVGDASYEHGTRTRRWCYPSTRRRRGMDPVSAETRDRIESDPFCTSLGINVVALEPGGARTRLTLRDEHLNFHGTAHGGVIYTLADAAFAAACNAGGATRIALETNTSYLAAASVGETLLAVAEETHVTRRTAEYQVVVRREEGEDDGTDEDERIATFRGRAYRM